LLKLLPNEIIRWILLGLFAFLSGFFIVQYMVSIFSVLAIYSILLTIAIAGTLILLIRAFKGKKIFLAVILVAIIGLGGYASANYLFLSQEDFYELGTITRTDGGDGHTAILYFTHGEPPGYDPLPWILTMREFEHDNVPFIPWLVRPFFFNMMRNEYIQAGGSPHNKLHKAFFDNLRWNMPQEVANGTRFYLAFLDTEPHPDQMAIKAINNGASKIIILPIFVTESTHTIAGQELIASVEPEKYGVQTIYTGALGDSDLLQSVFVDRANELSIGYEKSEIGILLVGHGQPDEWEELYPEQNLQEDQYRQGIREKLIDDGFYAQNVVPGWMSFQEPTIAQSAKVLADNNVKKILVFSVSLSADAIHSEVDAPKGVAEADLPDEIKIEYIGQYGDHPFAIQAMIEKIEAVNK
jgi:protoheme ferro-lyase